MAGSACGVVHARATDQACAVHLSTAPRWQISVVDGRSGEIRVALVGDREHHLADFYAVAVDEE
jgi:hypothetical protein